MNVHQIESGVRNMRPTSQKVKAVAAAAGEPASADWVALNASQRCDEARYFEQELFARVVAQEDAVLALSQLYQLYLAKLPCTGSRSARYCSWGRPGRARRVRSRSPPKFSSATRTR